MDNKEQINQYANFNPWQKFGVANKNIWSGYINVLNANELIIAFNNDKDADPSGICIYNIFSKQLTHIAEYPQNCMYSQDQDLFTWLMLHQAIYDKSCHQLFLYFQLLSMSSPKDHKLLKFNIKLKCFSNDYPISPPKQIYFALNIKNQVHLLCENREHYIYDEKVKNLIFKGHFMENIFNQGHIESVYVESQHKIISIVCEKKTNTETVMIGTFGYCLKSKKWKKMMDPVTYESGAVTVFLTQDERYIIIAPMLEEGCNDILILDIIGDNDEYKIRKSKIHPPALKAQEVYRRFAMIHDDIKCEIMVYGFVRKTCMEYRMDMIHQDVMSVITSCCSFDVLHCVNIVNRGFQEKMDCDHWLIPVCFLV